MNKLLCFFHLHNYKLEYWKLVCTRCKDEIAVECLHEWTKICEKPSIIKTFFHAKLIHSTLLACKKCGTTRII